MKIVASTEDDSQIKVSVLIDRLFRTSSFFRGLGADGIVLRLLKTSDTVPVSFPCAFFCFLFF